VTMDFQVLPKLRRLQRRFGMSLEVDPPPLVRLARPLLTDLTLVSSLVFLVDVDIENQQPAFYSDLITALRAEFATGSKPYYITGAPQYFQPRHF